MNQIQINPNFHKRVETCTKRIGKFLTFYKTPAQYFDLDTGELKEPEVKAWIKLIAETTNGQIDGSLTDEPFDERVREIIATVAKSYKGRDWPMPHHFETAAHIIAKRHQKQTPSQASSIDTDAISMAVQRIEAGGAVDDRFLFPPLAQELVKLGISQDKIDLYQKSFFHSMIKTHGPIEGEQKFSAYAAQRATYAEDPDSPMQERAQDGARQAIASAMQSFKPVRAQHG